MYRSHNIRADGIGGSCAGDTEIGQLDLTIGRDHDILRLNVTVYQTTLMGGFQTKGDLNSNAGSLSDA